MSSKQEIINNELVVAEQDMHLIEMLFVANQAAQGWQEFLDEFTRHFNLKNSHLYIVHKENKNLRFQDWSGIRPSDQDLMSYVEKYVYDDPYQDMILSSPPGKFYSSNLHVEQEVLEKSLMYSGWAVPQGIIGAAAGIIFSEGDWLAILHSNRGEGSDNYSQSELNRLTAFVPYVEKALKLRIELAEGKNDQPESESLLNKFSLPVILFNEFSEPVAYNKKISELQQKNPALEITLGQSISLGDEQLDWNFYLNITEAITSAKGRSIGYGYKTVAMTDSKTQYFIGVEPIVETDLDSSDVFVGVIAYWVGGESLISAEKLQGLFDLTDAESQVCAYFINGMPLKDIASLRNKSINTIREQLQSCYKKTHCKNQLELMNLLASIPSD